MIGVHRVKRKFKRQATNLIPNELDVHHIVDPSQSTYIQNALTSASRPPRLSRWIKSPITSPDKQEVYFVGIVDCLQSYNFVKWMEKEWKDTALFLPRRKSHTLDKQAKLRKKSCSSTLENFAVPHSSVLLKKSESISHLVGLENSVEAPDRYAQRLLIFLDSIIE